MGELKQLRKNTPQFQRTYLTPFDNLDGFVSAILSQAESDGATLTIDQVVFDTDNLDAVVERDTGCSLESDGVTFHANGAASVQALLISALSDPIDFLYIPSPKVFMIYADHDGYTTFYANTKPNFNKVKVPLDSKGFKLINAWTSPL